MCLVRLATLRYSSASGFPDANYMKLSRSICGVTCVSSCVFIPCMLCQGVVVTLVRRTVVSFLGQFPTFGPHLAPNWHLWLQVVVSIWLRPHAWQRFRRTGQTRWGYSHRSFKHMVKRGLSILACEDCNLWRVRKKQVGACSTGSKHRQHRTVESREHIETLKANLVIHCIRTYLQSSWLVLPLDQGGLDERVRPTICATPPHFNQSHVQVITSPTSSSSSLPTESAKSCGDGELANQQVWMHSRCSYEPTHRRLRPYGRFFTRSKQ